MNQLLYFVTNIIRPWERLNKELTNQSSVDLNISDFVGIAENLSIKLSHYPEFVGRKSLRTNKSEKSFNIIVDLADTVKHIKIVESRITKLTVSSVFEYKEKNKFRFIRNKIVLDHTQYGKSDFLIISKDAIKYLISKLKLNVVWEQSIFEAPPIFKEKVSLNLFFERQILFTGLQLEILKMNQDGKLIHFDPPEMLFELSSPNYNYAISFNEYIEKLLLRSFTKIIKLEKEVSIEFQNNNLVGDFVVTSFESNAQIIYLIQIVESNSIDNNILLFYESILKSTSIEKIILISKDQFPKLVKGKVCLEHRNIFLISINKFDAYSIPIGFFQIHYKYFFIKITKIHSATLGILEKDSELFEPFSGKPINSLGNVFSRDKKYFMNFIGLCSSFIHPKENESRGRKKIKYKPRSEIDIFIKIDEKIIKIGLEAEVDWESTQNELRMPILNYERSQIGISVWLLETKFHNDSGISELKVPVTKYGETSALTFLPPLVDKGESAI